MAITKPQTAKPTKGDRIRDAAHVAAVLGAKGTPVERIEQFLGVERTAPPARTLSANFAVTAADMETLGVSGVIRDEAGLPRYDSNPDLYPVRSRGLFDDPGIYREMALSDPVLAGVLSMVIRKISRAQIRLKTIDDPTPQEELAQRLAARYMGTDGTPGLLHGGRHSLMKHACQAIIYGSSCMEITWDSASTFEGLPVWSPSKVKWRSASSVERILWKGDDLLGIQQIVQDEQALDTPPSPSGTTFQHASTSGGFRRIVIPASRLLWFGYGDLDGNPEGVSALRAAFRYWQLKQNTLRRIEAAESLLFGGVTILEMLETEDFKAHPAVSENDVGFWQDVLELWKSGDLEYLLKPRGWDLKQQWPDYELEDRTAYLTWIDFQLLITLSAAIFGLPSSQAASASLSGSMGQVFYDSLSDMAQGFLDVINGIHGQPMTGLIRQLVDANVATGEGFRYPQFEVIGLEHQDLKTFADVYTKLVQYFGITPGPEDEAHIREVFSLPRGSIASIKENQDAWQGRQRRLSETGQQGPQTGVAQPQEVTE